MIVRIAQGGDAQRIAEIWNKIIRDTVATFNSREKTIAELQGDIATRNGAFWVAEIEGQVIGFATYFQFRGGPGYARTMEHTIYLTDAARGHGAGRALMKTLETHAQLAGVHSLFAGVGGENEPGLLFHRAIGYEPVARLREVGFKFGRWMDLTLLQKIL